MGHMHYSQCSGCKNLFSQSYLSEIQVNKAEREELQTDGETVQQPVHCHREVIGFQSVPEVKGKQGGTESSPEQTKEQEDALVAPSFVSI